MRLYSEKGKVDVIREIKRGTVIFKSTRFCYLLSLDSCMETIGSGILCMTICNNLYNLLQWCCA